MVTQSLRSSLKSVSTRISNLETYIDERSCEGIFIEVDCSDFRYVLPGFLEPDERATLHYTNGNIVLIARGGTHGSREWLANDLPPAIRFALTDSLARLKRHCDRIVADANIDIDGLMAQLAALPTPAEIRQGRYSAQSSSAQSRKQDCGSSPSANFSARSSMSDLKNYLKSISKRR